MERHYNSGKNNPRYGVRVSEETRAKIRATKLAKKNPMWKGNGVGYDALHVYIKNRLPKTKLCQECNKVPPRDLANKGVYDRNLQNWEWLCRRCHMVKDGRLAALVRRNKGG